MRFALGLVLAIAVLAWLLFHFWATERSIDDNIGGTTFTLNAPDPMAGTRNSPNETQVLDHDFGIIQPDSIQTHRFAIANPSAYRWNFERTSTTCSCVRPTISGPYIEPHSTGWVDVRYKAPSKEVDDTRAIDITFNEPDTPRLRLVTRASIRQFLHAFPGSILLSRVAGDVCLPVDVEIRNYSSTRWKQLSALSHDAWVSCYDPAEVDTARGKGEAHAGPLQLWRLSIILDPRKLRLGTHRSTISLNGGGYHRDLPVDVRLVPPVSAVPSQLFFGEIATRGHAEREIKLVFTDAAAPTDATRILATHDLGDALQVTLQRGTSRRYWRLLATFRPNASHGTIHDALHIATADHVLEIPITASVYDPTGDAAP